MILHYFTVNRPKQSPPIQKAWTQNTCCELKEWRFRNISKHIFVPRERPSTPYRLQQITPPHFLSWQSLKSELLMTATDETTFSRHPSTQNWTKDFWDWEIVSYQSISEEPTPSTVTECAQFKGPPPPPPTGLPCPYTKLFVTYHLFFCIQNGDKRFPQYAGTHTRQHIPEGNVLHLAASLKCTN